MRIGARSAAQPQPQEAIRDQPNHSSQLEHPSLTWVGHGYTSVQTHRSQYDFVVYSLRRPTEASYTSDIKNLGSDKS